MLSNINYNIKFRKELPVDILGIFISNGIITGSSLVVTDYNDIDIAVLCSSHLVANIKGRISNEDDLAQYVFMWLLTEGYSLYISGNYRDSTFLSCYVHNKGQIYNLLLMDESNVFGEWKYATEKLKEFKADPLMQNKYDRVKYFEKCRKEYRRQLKM